MLIDSIDREIQDLKEGEFDTGGEGAKQVLINEYKMKVDLTTSLWTDRISLTLRTASAIRDDV